MTQAPSLHTESTASYDGDARLRVVVSLDVEEEGLFSGRYAATDCTTRNVRLLPRLAPLTKELGFPLTLLCTHTVFMDPDARIALARMRDNLGAEIGAHLHHWSTPPPGLESNPPVPADQLPEELLRVRLRALMRAGRDFQGAPLRSFRMGRWDLKANLRPLLSEEGIEVDSSVCPLRVFANGPDHFLAPPDPYWVNGVGENRLLEAPITQVALFPSTARAFYALAQGLPETRRQRFIDSFHFWGTLSANPIWHSSTIMNLATRLHVERGGKVLCLFWHSSEMLPGASPHIRTQKDADTLFTRIYSYLRRLKEEFSVQPVTLSSLFTDPISQNFTVRGDTAGDW